MITVCSLCIFFFFSSRRRHTRYWRDWSSDVCSSDLARVEHVHAGDHKGLLGGERIFLHQLIVGLYVVFLLFPLEFEPGFGPFPVRSEERRVGKECRSRWSPYH